MFCPMCGKELKRLTGDLIESLDFCETCEVVWKKENHVSSPYKVTEVE